MRSHENNEKPTRLLTLVEAADLLRVSVRRVKALIENGELDSVSLNLPGGKRPHLRLVASRVEEYLSSHRLGASMTMGQVAYVLRISEDQVLKLICEGEIKAQQGAKGSGSNKMTISADEVQSFIDRQPTNREKRKRNLEERCRAALLSSAFHREDREVWTEIQRPPLSKMPIREAIEEAKKIVIERVRASGEGLPYERRRKLTLADGTVPDIPTPKQLKALRERELGEQTMADTSRNVE